MVKNIRLIYYKHWLKVMIIYLLFLANYFIFRALFPKIWLLFLFLVIMIYFVTDNIGILFLLLCINSVLAAMSTLTELVLVAALLEIYSIFLLCGLLFLGCPKKAFLKYLILNFTASVVMLMLAVWGLSDGGFFVNNFRLDVLILCTLGIKLGLAPTHRFVYQFYADLNLKSFIFINVTSSYGMFILLNLTISNFNVFYLTFFLLLSCFTNLLYGCYLMLFRFSIWEIFVAQSIINTSFYIPMLYLIPKNTSIAAVTLLFLVQILSWVICFRYQIFKVYFVYAFLLVFGFPPSIMFLLKVELLLQLTREPQILFVFPPYLIGSLTLPYIIYCYLIIKHIYKNLPIDRT